MRTPTRAWTRADDDDDDSRTYATFSAGGGSARTRSDEARSADDDDDDDDDDASIWATPHRAVASASPAATTRRASVASPLARVAASSWHVASASQSAASASRYVVPASQSAASASQYVAPASQAAASASRYVAPASSSSTASASQSAAPPPPPAASTRRASVASSLPDVAARRANVAPQLAPSAAYTAAYTPALRVRTGARHERGTSKRDADESFSIAGPRARRARNDVPVRNEEDEDEDDLAPAVTVEPEASRFDRAPAPELLARVRPPWEAPLADARQARASVEYARAEVAAQLALDDDPVIRAATLIAGYARIQLSSLIEFTHSHAGAPRPSSLRALSPTLAAYLGNGDARRADAARDTALATHAVLMSPRVTGRYRALELFTTHTRAAWRLLRTEYGARFADVPLRTLLVSDAFVDAFALLAASSLGASGVRLARRASDVLEYANQRRHALAEFAHARYVPGAANERERLVYVASARGGLDIGAGVSPEAAYGAALERYDPSAAARARASAVLRASDGYEPVRSTGARR